MQKQEDSEEEENATTAWRKHTERVNEWKMNWNSDNRVEESKRT